MAPVVRSRVSACLVFVALHHVGGNDAVGLEHMRTGRVVKINRAVSHLGVLPLKEQTQ